MLFAVCLFFLKMTLGISKFIFIIIHLQIKSVQTFGCGWDYKFQNMHNFKTRVEFKLNVSIYIIALTIILLELGI